MYVHCNTCGLFCQAVILAVTDMSKADVTKTTKSSTVTSGQQFDVVAFAAQSRFITTALGMGWRLALTVLIPLIAGIKLDKYYHTSPSYTLAGFMLAVAGGSYVVWTTVKAVNAETAEIDAENAAKAKASSSRGKKA